MRLQDTRVRVQQIKKQSNWSFVHFKKNSNVSSLKKTYLNKDDHWVMIVLYGRRVISLFIKFSWCPGWSAPAQWHWFFQTTTAGWERQGHTCSWRLAAQSDCYQYSCYWQDDTDSYSGGKINIYILYRKLTFSHDIYFILYRICRQGKIQHSLVNTNFTAIA